MPETIQLIDLFRYYKEQSHQIAAINELQDSINEAAPGLLSRNSDWYELWKAAPELKPTEFSNSWDGIMRLAEQAGAKFPECVAAQWALESGYGQFLSGKNNYFGIKGKGTVKTTQEDYGKGMVTVQDEFKDFATPLDCISELVNKWYKDYKNYKGVNRARSREECARLLKSEGYATDPNYAPKLIKIMDAKA